MSRPSKEKLKQRENIKELRLFVRDSYMYQISEESTKGKSPYIFCMLCEIRNKTPKDNNNVLVDKEETIVFHQSFHLGNGYNFVDEYKNINTQSVLKLREIDNVLSDYFQSIWYEGAYKISVELQIVDMESYYPKTQIRREVLNNVLGKKRVDEVIKSVYNYFSDSNEFIELESIALTLTKDDKEKLYIYFLKKGEEPKTIIFNRMNLQNTGGLERERSENTVFLELDFTKPLDDLIEIVTKIKNDFNKSSKTISNFYGLVGFKTHNSSFDDLELYKTNNIKPLGGRLADTLFIYDCKKAGLDNDYILDEINKYWTETQNLFKDKMQLKTLREYHSLAVDYIDNKKYKCYLSGYDTLKEK